MTKQRLKEKKPNQYLIFDDAGYVAVCNGNLKDEIVEGEDRLIEVMEELAGDYPDTIEDFKIFKIEPVCFETHVQEISVTLGC